MYSYTNAASKGYNSILNVGMTNLYIDPFGKPWRYQPLRLLFCQWKSSSLFQFFWLEWVFATIRCALFLFFWQLCPSFLASTLLRFTNTRWWEVRYLEGIVIGCINNLSVQIAALIRDKTYKSQKWLVESNGLSASKNGQDKDEKIGDSDMIQRATTVRAHLVRCLNLAHAIAVGELNEKCPNQFSSIENLVQLGLLSESEYEYLSENPHSRKYNTNSRISCRYIDVSLSYRQLVNATVRFYAAIIALGTATYTDANDAKTTFSVTPALFWGLLAFLFEYFLFVNPFRTWADDFEWESCVSSVTISSNLYVGKMRGASTTLGRLETDEYEALERKRQVILPQWAIMKNTVIVW